MGMIQEQRTECPEQITSSAASFQYINHISFLYLFFHLFVLLSIFYAHATLLFILLSYMHIFQPVPSLRMLSSPAKQLFILYWWFLETASIFISLYPLRFLSQLIQAAGLLWISNGSLKIPQWKRASRWKSVLLLCPEGWPFSSKLLRVQAWSGASCSPACADFSKLSHM